MAHDSETLKKVDELRTRILGLPITVGLELTPEQAERERFQAELNAYAEATPMFAVARQIGSSYPIVPLEPLGREPLATQPTRDIATIYEHWQLHPQANVGVPIGRSSGIIAMHLEDAQAAKRLRRLTVVEMHNPETGESWQEHRALEASWLRFVRTLGMSQRTITGWGKDVDQQAQQWSKAMEPPEESWLLWSYPHVMTGQDGFEYGQRRVVRGVEVVAPGTIIPFAGSRFEDYLALSGAVAPLPTMPTWLASMIGKPRSRKVMAAAREAYELAQHQLTDLDALHLEQARALAREQRQAEQTRAQAELAKLESKEPKPELPDVLPDEDDEQESPPGVGWIR